MQMNAPTGGGSDRVVMMMAKLATLALALLPLIGLAACGDPPPSARLEGCVLRVGDVIVDLRQVIGFEWDTGTNNHSDILLRGTYTASRIAPHDRERIEAAWQTCLGEVNAGSENSQRDGMVIVAIGPQSVNQ